MLLRRNSKASAMASRQLARPNYQCHSMLTIVTISCYGVNATVLMREPVAASTKRVRGEGPIQADRAHVSANPDHIAALLLAEPTMISPVVVSTPGRQPSNVQPPPGRVTRVFGAMAPSPDVIWTPFTTKSPNVDPSALLVARAPLLVLLTVAVRLLAVISPFSSFTLNTVATLCAAAASPIDPDVVPVRPSVVIVPGTLSASASPSTMAPSAGATAGSTASADCCVPLGPCTSAPYAWPLTDCAGVSGASAAVTPFNSHSATTTCIARILERLILRPILSSSRQVPNVPGCCHP